VVVVSRLSYIVAFARLLSSGTIALIVSFAPADLWQQGFSTIESPAIAAAPDIITPSPLLETRTELLRALDARAPKLTEMERVWLADIVAQAAFDHGVDPFLILAVMMVESEFRDVAKSNRGAIGFMQLRTPTAFEWSDKIGKPMAALGLYDWEMNIELGAAYLRFLRDRMGSWPMALAGYNWGPTKVYLLIRENKGRIPFEVRAYERRVMRAYDRLTKAAGHEAPQPLSQLKIDKHRAI
jgi:soluble lytic murein transglycosylase